MINRLGTLVLVVLAGLVIGGCGNRGRSGEEVPEVEPTVTPLVEELAEISTFTPTPVVVVPEATPTEVPTAVPTPTVVISLASTNVQANLRAGPG